MKNQEITTNLHVEIAKVIELYINGARTGDSDMMATAFHQDATIFGYMGDQLVAGPIRNLYEWNDQNGPAPGLEFHIDDINLAGSVASVRLELENWTGFRFTDMFTLLNIDGEWKIMNKVFHLHQQDNSQN